MTHVEHIWFAKQFSWMLSAWKYVYLFTCTYSVIPSWRKLSSYIHHFSSRFQEESSTSSPTKPDYWAIWGDLYAFLVLQMAHVNSLTQLRCKCPPKCSGLAVITLPQPFLTKDHLTNRWWQNLHWVWGAFISDSFHSFIWCDYSSMS